MAEYVLVGEVLLCFPARLFEHAVEHVSDRLASVVLREREVGAGYAELFRVIETCDLRGCQLVGEVSSGGRVVVVRSHGPPLSVATATPRRLSHWAHIGHGVWR
jgi:hypothetical protein